MILYEIYLPLETDKCQIDVSKIWSRKIISIGHMHLFSHIEMIRPFGV